MITMHDSWCGSDVMLCGFTSSVMPCLESQILTAVKESIESIKYKESKEALNAVAIVMANEEGFFPKERNNKT